MGIFRRMNILLASNNLHKKQEFERLLAPHTIAMPSELGIVFDFEEDKSSFTENALGKAESLRALVPDRWAILSDDSGLCVDALDGGPGVRTARYGMDVFGRLLESDERNAYLLRNLSHLSSDEERKAYFVCALALIVDRWRVFTICESVQGHIAKQSYGAGGFGYDPVFIVSEAGKTMAQLSDEEKDLYSHRGRACRHIKTLLGALS